MTSALPIHDDWSGVPEALQVPAGRELCREAAQSIHEGIESLQVGDAKTAVAAFSKAIEYAPDFGGAHVFLGIANALTCNIYPAIDSLQRAAELEPKSFAAHYTMAQLSFKLRTPQKGYEAAERALKCVQTLEQRKMLTQLLRDEKARERNGISRPWFYKPFNSTYVLLAGGGLAAAILILIARVH